MKASVTLVDSSRCSKCISQEFAARWKLPLNGGTMQAAWSATYDNSVSTRSARWPARPSLRGVTKATTAYEGIIDAQKHPQFANAYARARHAARPVWFRCIAFSARWFPCNVDHLWVQ